MAAPTVAIRINSQLYDELVKVAEARDVTITQAMGIYSKRLIDQAVEDALAKQKPKEIVKTVIKEVIKDRVVEAPNAKCGICGKRMNEHIPAGRDGVFHGWLCPK